MNLKIEMLQIAKSASQEKNFTSTMRRARLGSGINQTLTIPGRGRGYDGSVVQYVRLLGGQGNDALTN